MTYYPFGPLAPDADPRLNDQLARVADGVLPTRDGYKPVGQWVGTYSALPGKPKGGATFIGPDGQTQIIAGTSGSLFRASAGGWEQISTGFSLQGDMRWRFVQFGGLAIAANLAGVMQKIDLATMTVSPLGGSPPKFESLGVLKGFLIGTVLDGDVMTIGWSAAYNAEKWTFGSGQSDYYTLPTGGRVNGVFSGEFGLILQRDRLMRLDYVGGNLILDPNEVSSNIGCVTPHSAAQWGNLGFFLSDEGFMQWDGSSVTPIGRGLIDEEFSARYSASDYSSMSTAIEPKLGVVMWSMADRIYCYDWGLQKWSTLPIAAPVIFSGVSKAISLDETDPTLVGDNNLDTPGLPSFDLTSLGGDAQLYAFSADYRMGTFDGTPMVATIGLNDLEVFPGRRANLRYVRPDIDCTGGLSLALGAKQRLGDPLVTSTSAVLVTSGDMPVRSSGRYIRPAVTVAAGTIWTHAKGVELVGAPGPMR